MTPYYQDELVTIYHADCAEIIAGLPDVDLVLTDPPYGIGEAAGKNKSRSYLANSVDYGDEGWDDSPVSQTLIDACVSKGARAVVWGGNYYALPPSKCWLVWDKGNGANHFADCELAWSNIDRAVRMKRHRWHGFLRKGREQRIGHPTQKPLELMSWCLSLPRIDVRSVLDPFMGSGTTLRACKDRGLRAIGIDQSERFCDMAARRMSQQAFNFEVTT